MSLEQNPAAGKDYADVHDYHKKHVIHQEVLVVLCELNLTSDKTISDPSDKMQQDKTSSNLRLGIGSQHWKQVFINLANK